MKQPHRISNHRLLRSFAMVIVFAVGALALTVNAAEKREYNYVRTGDRTAHKTVISIDDVPNHELTQEMGISNLKYPDSNLGESEQWTYATNDLIKGSGVHDGYFIETFTDGSKRYGDYEGTTKTITRVDGSWESTWQGTYKYLGGSGRFKGIKGAGTYKGRVSSTEAMREEGHEVVEF